MQRGPDGRDALVSLFAVDAVYSEPFSGTGPHRGREAISAYLTVSAADVPADLTVAVERVDVEVDTVTAWWRCEAPAFSEPVRGRDRFVVRSGLIASLDTLLLGGPRPPEESGSSGRRESSPSDTGAALAGSAAGLTGRGHEEITMWSNEQVDAYVAAKVPEHLQEVARSAIGAITDGLPDAALAIRWSHPTWSLGKAPVAYLKAASRHHLTFGFWRGASIDDPSGRLESSGKVMAHTKLRTLSDVDPPLFAQWLQQAARLEDT